MRNTGKMMVANYLDPYPLSQCLALDFNGVSKLGSVYPIDLFHVTLFPFLSLNLSSIFSLLGIRSWHAHCWVCLSRKKRFNSFTSLSFSKFAMMKIIDDIELGYLFRYMCMCNQPKTDPVLIDAFGFNAKNTIDPFFITYLQTPKSYKYNFNQKWIFCSTIER